MSPEVSSNESISCLPDHCIASDVVAGLSVKSEDLWDHLNQFIMGDGIISPSDIGLEEEGKDEY